MKRLNSALATLMPLVWMAAAVHAAGVPSHPSGFDKSGMQTGVRPGDDFFAFANGAWVARTQIPSERSSTGTFPDLRSRANDRVHLLLQELAARRSPLRGSAAKVAILYRAFMDEDAVRARGAAPLIADIGRIQSAQSRDDLAEVIGLSFQSFGASLFDLDLSKDETAPSVYAVHLGQGGLGLPDRSYYLDPAYAPQRAAYQSYAASLLNKVGWTDPEVAAQQVVAFETLVAQASVSHEDLRDPAKVINPMDRPSVDRLGPEFPWSRFLAGAGLGRTRRFIVSTPGSVAAIARLFARTPLQTLKAWEAFRTADVAAPYLTEPFVSANFEFRRRSLQGQREIAPRWSRAVDMANEAMGSAVGELYVAAYASEADRAKMAELVENVRKALHARIAAANWMSQAARDEALAKLSRLEVQIGRPAQWINYSALTVAPGDLYGDVKRARAFEWKRRLGELPGPWNKSEWRFWPQYPTAYSENGQMIYTASMLQPPFFSANADPAINYGGIGAVIGHELSHHFDDQGRTTDSHGMLRDWWSPQDDRRFEALGKALSAQYDAFEPLPGLHVKGDLTLGENIADLGGLNIALDAYHASLNGSPAPEVDGFTGDQRVFLGWAQAWREKSSDDALRRLVATDVHAPGVARVDGVVRNMDVWYAAFRVVPGDKLYLSPAERVRIW